MRKIIMLCFLAVGCGGSEQEDGGPITCDPANRQGSYLMSFETLSGNCGEQASALVRLDADVDPFAGGCEPLASDRWSDGNCTLERRARCPFEEFAPGATIESTMISTQQDAAGEVITGTLTMTLKNATGQIVCFGTYGVDAVRQ